MTTQYSPILKLALPVQGELSGTWGDVVNDNITSMVEQAIAGRAVINSWSTNSHTLTSANGTTSESRCAMLELTDTGTALSGAGTVVCPTASKIYIVKNAAGQNITVKTASGTGILVPNGRTTFLFCDGTNVVEALTHTTSLQLGTSTTVTAVLDEDNMASNSATSLATQQSIKAYVDAQVGSNNELSEVLANGNTTGGTNIVVSVDDVISLDNGTNALPSLTTTGDLNTGIYFPAADEVGITTGGTQRVKVDSAGVDVTGTLDVTGVATATTFEPDGDTSAGDNAAIGYTAAEGLILTGQGSTNDVTIKNDADADVLEIPTGTTNVTIVGNLGVGGTVTATGTSVFASLDISGDIDVDGTTNLDVVDIDGAVDFASTTAHAGNATFADNAKAIFGGATSELQIYSDGSSSRIVDAGTGSLKIQAENFAVNNVGDTENMITAVPDGAVQLFYDNAPKLATTSTGIDVTGTVTADGLTVDATSAIGLVSDKTVTTPHTDYNLLLDNGSDTEFVIRLDSVFSGSVGSSHIKQISEGTNRGALVFATERGSGGVVPDRLKIDYNGDISFYEDTGTTAKFFWSASDERLGIGTASPSAALEIVSTTSIAGARLSTSAGSDSEIEFINTSSGNHTWAVGQDFSNSNAFSIAYNNAVGASLSSNAKVVIDSSGRLGLKTTAMSSFNQISGADLFVMGSGAGNQGMTIYSGNTGTGTIAFADGTTTSQQYEGIIQYDHSANSMTFYSNHAERMRIDSSGNVGIGQSPNMKLNILHADEDGIRLNTADGAASFIDFGDASDNDIGRISYDHADNHMAFRTNNAERMRIDSSGNVGIGESSPSTYGKLVVDDGKISLVTDTASSRRISFWSTANGNSENAYIQSQNDGATTNTGEILFATKNASGTLAERMRIDSSGNVGIGRSAPSHPLHIGDTSGNTILELQRTNTNASGTVGAISFTASDDHSVAAIHASGDGDNEGAHLIFRTTSAASQNNYFNSTSERMRIDSSGNLLVGTTTLDIANNGSNTGFVVNSNGAVEAGSSSTVLTLNKYADDDIIRLQKDGATVGSIGAGSGDLIIGNDSVGVRFNDSISSLVPRTTSDSAADGTIDLGFNTARFRNAFLSGGVYLGGTGSANKLDDYEEGTHDLVVSGASTGTKTFTYNASVQGLRYTKIGNKVFCELLINNQHLPTYTGSLRFSLPFASAGGAFESISGDLYFYPSSAWDSFSNFTGLTSRLGSSQSHLLLGIKVVDADRQTILADNNSSTSGAQIYLRFSFSYTAA